LIVSYPTWQITVLVAIVFEIIVYPILIFFERFKKYSEFTTERKSGELKHSLMLVYTMFAVVVAVCWGYFGDKYLALVKKVYVAMPAGILLGVLVFVLRRQFGAEYDYIFAPLFVIATVSVFRFIPPVYKLLKEIGSVSTEIWLIHTFFCYHFIPKIIYAPKNAILITLWLLLISYLSGKALVILSAQAEKLIKKIKIKATKKPSA
jgi:hypothetical protein